MTFEEAIRRDSKDVYLQIALSAFYKDVPCAHIYRNGLWTLHSPDGAKISPEFTSLDILEDWILLNEEVLREKHV